MQIPVQITVRGMPHSEALDARIREKCTKLAQFHPAITSVRVSVEESGKHREGRQFLVNLDVRVPGGEFVANHPHDADVYVALRDSFGAVRRQLEDHVRVKRDFVTTLPNARPREPD